MIPEKGLGVSSHHGGGSPVKKESITGFGKPGVGGILDGMGEVHVKTSILSDGESQAG
jgi:hypothetical protein